MQVQQFYDYTDMLKANLQSAITIGGKLQFKDDKQYQEFLDAGLIIGSLLVNSESANVYNTSDNTIWDAVEAKVTLWGGNPQSDMNLRHLALLEVLEPLSAPDDILVQIEKVRVVAKFDVKDDETLEFGGNVYVQADPYSKMLIPQTTGGTDLRYRFFLDATNGNDENDGQSWVNALKTVQAAIDKLPSNLDGHKGVLIFAPGTYDGRIELDKFKNGEVIFQHISKRQYEQMSQETIDTYGDFIGINTLGVAPYSSTENVKFKYTQDVITTSALIRSNNQTDSGFKLSIANSTYGKNWNEDDFAMAEAFEFVGPDVTGSGESVYNHFFDLKNCAFFVDQAKPIFNFKGLATSAFILAGNVEFTMKSGSFIGGDGNASVSTSHPFGAIIANNPGNKIITECWKAYNYVDQISGSVLANQKRWSITGFRRFIYSFNTNDLSIDLSSTSMIEYLQGSLPDADLPKLITHSNDSGYLKYNDTLFVLEDNSLVAHNVYKNGVLTSFIGGGLKKQTSTIIPISSTVPSDAELANKDLVFYMDEATDTLKVKYKDSGGVVQTGDIAILT